MLTLISAKASPYARKVRIALAEKQIPFTLQTEVPWDSTTQTPQWNPLEKLPVLIPQDGKAVYESHYILEWLDIKYPSTPALLPPPDQIDDRLSVKQIEVVADGVLDALVLTFFEKAREEHLQSKPWLARQTRKVEGGLKALNDWVEKKQGDYVTPGGFGIADIALGCVCGYLNFRFPDHVWKERHPNLKRHWEFLESRQSFKDTVPSPQTVKDKVV